MDNRRDIQNESAEIVLRGPLFPTVVLAVSSVMTSVICLQITLNSSVNLPLRIIAVFPTALSAYFACRSWFCGTWARGDGLTCRYLTRTVEFPVSEVRDILVGRFVGWPALSVVLKSGAEKRLPASGTPDNAAAAEETRVALRHVLGLRA